jgi:ADP-heptose:LPS heptosyltransferase
VAFLKRVEGKIKRLAFVPLSLFLSEGDSSRRVPTRSEVRRILLLRPETKIGDMVISLPVVRHLRQSWPDAELYMFCSKRNESVISGESRLAGLFCYSKNIIRDFFQVRNIRRLNCDVVIDLLYHDSLTTLILSQWSAPNAFRIGGGKKRFAKFYHWAGPWAHSHIIDCTLSLLEPLGIDISRASRQVPIATDESCRNRAQLVSEEVRRTCSIACGINVSAGTATRVWGPANFESLVTHSLAAHPNLGIVLLGTPSDRHKYEFLAKRFPQRVIVPTNGTSIQDASALIAELDFVVSADTAIVHIARALDKPVVGLYTGNISNRLKFQPWGDGNIVVIARHEGNIYDITVEDVSLAVTRMIEQLSTRKESRV